MRSLCLVARSPLPRASRSGDNALGEHRRVSAVDGDHLQAARRERLTVIHISSAQVGTNVEGGIIANSGHWIMEDQPAATVKAVRDFLEN